MHDEVAVRVRDRGADLQQQGESRAHVELARVAIARDRLALDVFEREIRRAVVGDAAVVQLRDVRMHEPREDLALAQEAQRASRRRRNRRGCASARRAARTRRPSRSARNTWPMPPSPIRRSSAIRADAPAGEILRSDFVLEQAAEQAVAVVARRSAPAAPARRAALRPHRAASGSSAHASTSHAARASSAHILASRNSSLTRSQRCISRDAARRHRLLQAGARELPVAAHRALVAAELGGDLVERQPGEEMPFDQLREIGIALRRAWSAPRRARAPARRSRSARSSVATSSVLDARRRA